MEMHCLARNDVVMRCYTVVLFLLLSILAKPALSIVNGQEAAPGEFPNVVALLLDMPDSEARERQFCGGSVIDERWVLTAAHCLVNADGTIVDASNITVLADTTSLDDPGSEEIPVSAIYIHTNYQTFPIPYNDIALIKLSVPTSVAPIKISAEDGNRLAGDPGVGVGWGATGNDVDGEDGASLFPVQQQKLTLPLASRSVCNLVANYGGLIAREHLCAGRIQGGIDSCYGDSGGPLLYYTEETGFEQIGIVSFGNECAIPYSYGVYTAVDFYVNWVEGITSIYGPNQQADSIAIYDSADTGSLGYLFTLILSLFALLKINIKLALSIRCRRQAQ